MLPKIIEATYWPGLTSSYLIDTFDNVMTADHLKFQSFSGSSISAIDWIEESTSAKKDQWALKYSDHALVYFEVRKKLIVICIRNELIT